LKDAEVGALKIELGERESALGSLAIVTKPYKVRQSLIIASQFVLTRRKVYKIFMPDRTKSYQSVSSGNKAQQSLTQSVGQPNRAWFKAWNPVFHGLSPLDTL
jgi:hypothetical protein